MKNVHTLALLLGKMSDNKIVLNFRLTIYKHTKSPQYYKLYGLELSFGK